MPKGVALRERSWSLPLVSVLKCNVDATFWGSDCLTGRGVVFRDHHGSIVHMVVLKQFPSEAFVLRAAVLLAKRFLFQRICFETDSSIVCEAVMGARVCPVEISSIVFDIQTALSCFPEAKISRVSREANSLAHETAKLSTPILQEDQILTRIPKTLLMKAR
ncbi:uncharacterized protein LOC132301563 [Cornus florida]|uniref:uncharacterized protein LOC132301563 n=1 Tax=Cornus florida TaxID=4283 RepID=UPI00289D2A65|nr:uncharacterized protein LOC132301563 [Cornus florida]